MKKRITIILAVALAMSLCMSAAMAATPPVPPGQKDSSTLSDIKFKGGSLTLVPNPDSNVYGFSEVELIFGLRQIPMRREIYVADGTVATELILPDGTAHTPQDGRNRDDAAVTAEQVGICVTDTRAQDERKAWKVSVKMKQFFNKKDSTDPATDPETGTLPPFDAMLYLKDGVPKTNGYGKTAGVGSHTPPYQLMLNGDNIMIDTRDQDFIILKGEADLGIGTHTAQWKNEDISLKLGTNFNVIEKYRYQAIMTWTLESSE